MTLYNITPQNITRIMYTDLARGGTDADQRFIRLTSVPPSIGKSLRGSRVPLPLLVADNRCCCWAGLAPMDCGYCELNTMRHKDSLG